MTIKTLDDLLNSNEYDVNRFGSGNPCSDQMNDSDRWERCQEAAKHCEDGSTHAECLQDMRNVLECCFSDLDDSIKESINREIDACEEWHVNNGTINETIG